jgi:hypothetical protein
LSASADLGDGGIAVGPGGGQPLVGLDAPDDRVRCKRIPVYDWPDQRPPFTASRLKPSEVTGGRPQAKVYRRLRGMHCNAVDAVALQPWTLRASG